MSGALPPGGLHPPAPGGFHAPAPGGVSLGNDVVRRLSKRPNVAITVGDASGARVAQSRTALVQPGETSVSSYLWTLPTRPGGSTATVTTSTAATAGFTPTNAGLHVFRVVVTFADGTTVTREVKYTSA